jgi:hypothetical protein
MNSVIVHAAAAQMQDGNFLVTGGVGSLYSSLNNTVTCGFDGSGYNLNSAEMLTEDGWESNIPSLPVTIYDHCMVTVNSTTVFCEILDEGSNEWQTGPELPFGIYGSQMVEDQNGGVVLIGGQISSGGNLDTLHVFQLPQGGQDAVWTKLEQKMQTGRRLHTAFLVPDNIVDCS